MMCRTLKFEGGDLEMIQRYCLITQFPLVIALKVNEIVKYLHKTVHFTSSNSRNFWYSWLIT